MKRVQFTRAMMHIMLVALNHLRAVDEELCCWHLQCLGDIEKPLVQQAASTDLDIDQDVARDARPQRESLLGEAPLDP